MTGAFALLLAVAVHAAEPPAAETPPVAPAIDRTKQLQAYSLAVSSKLEAEQRDALSKIADDDRRLLAVVRYLSAFRTIESRWSWTKDRIEAYERSPEYAAAMTEIANVAARFAADNPGFVLYANKRTRSLEEQLSSWQSLGSVGHAALELRGQALATLAQPSYPEIPDETSIERFRNWLKAWRPSPAPTITAPGLSLHGQGRAYDFQIRDESGRTVADTQVSSIAVWDGQGWTEKLSRAVLASSTRLVGPLRDPYEPWHYEYRPGP
jgi:hypothetical protein